MSSFTPLVILPAEIQGEKEGPASGAVSEEEAHYADDFEDYDSDEVGVYKCVLVCVDV